MEENELRSIKDSIIAECKVIMKANEDLNNGGSAEILKKICLSSLERIRVLYVELKSKKFNDKSLIDGQKELLNLLETLPGFSITGMV